MYVYLHFTWFCCLAITKRVHWVCCSRSATFDAYLDFTAMKICPASMIPITTTTSSEESTVFTLFSVIVRLLARSLIPVQVTCVLTIRGKFPGSFLPQVSFPTKSTPLLPSTLSCWSRQQWLCFLRQSWFQLISSPFSCSNFSLGTKTTSLPQNWNSSVMNS